ncbi:Kinase, NEK [Giardia lamblia P15]|uniref:non-specific serine/threonine protein kinase n=1 Tax=Giardia intestinalis (strain P15) TaxID=658858 RepID=E1F535_GIAIA|nr:Kinase, NEK [Giardia lamblia P15]
MLKLPEYRHGKETVLSASEFSVVYRAIRLKDLADVAVKVTDTVKLAESGRSDYRHESRVLQNAMHPYILRAVYGYYDEETKKFLLETEYCRGGSLWGLMAWMRKSDMRFSEQEIWELFAQLASALHYLHKTNEHIGITAHLNLRPDNVLLTQDGTLKLCGFGYSVTRQPNKLFVLRNPGTAYHAPEVVAFTNSQGNSEGYTEAADIWSLGCMIYELCTFKRIENEPVSSFNPLPENLKTPGYADDLLILIKACLAPNPRERITAELLMASPPIQAAYARVNDILKAGKKWSGLVIEMQRELCQSAQA